MTDLTRTDPQTESPESTSLGFSFTVRDAVQIFAGSIAAANSAAAAAGDGFAEGYDNLVGIVPLGGFFSEQELGDTSLDRPPVVSVGLGNRIWRGVAVTGTTNDATDLGVLVWADSDGPPLLLADPGNAIPLGFVLRVPTAGFADCYMFSIGELAVLAVIANGLFAAFGTRVGNPA